MLDLKNKVVVVTGGAGFVGQQLVRLLVSVEARVFVLDNYVRDPKKTRLVKGARYSPGRVGDDATHLATCKSFFREADVVFNLAASVGGIHYNLNHQLDILAENTMLQLIPVIAAEQVGVENFLQVSSVCAYSPDVQTGVPVPEDAGTTGQVQEANRGYALAKRLGEEAALLSRIPHVVVVRPSNVAGPGDYYDGRAHVIPDLVRRAVTEEVLDVYSGADIVREFIHPFDVAAGMVRALAFGESGQVYNIGNPTNIVSIGDVAYLIQKATGKNSRIVFHEDNESGDKWRASDSRKLMSLGWAPRFDMTRIVEDEVDGFRK